MPQELNLNWGEALTLTSLLLNLSVGVILSLLLRWHFRRFGSTLTNRDDFAQVFPLIVLTTVLIISVVKSSLALSLGLVGALSVVRFRTPIKEPEELAYLFLSIAIGLGLGANQTTATIVASIAILTVITLLRWTKQKDENKNLHLTIDFQGGDEKDHDRILERLNGVLIKHVQASDLRRFDTRDQSLEATYLVCITSVEHLNTLVEELQNTFPSIGISFLDQNHMPSV